MLGFGGGGGGKQVFWRDKEIGVSKKARYIIGIAKNGATAKLLLLRQKQGNKIGIRAIKLCNNRTY